MSPIIKPSPIVIGDVTEAELSAIQVPVTKTNDTKELRDIRIRYARAIQARCAGDILASIEGSG